MFANLKSLELSLVQTGKIYIDETVFNATQLLEVAPDMLENVNLVVHVKRYHQILHTLLYMKTYNNFFENELLGLSLATLTFTISRDTPPNRVLHVAEMLPVRFPSLFESDLVKVYIPGGMCSVLTDS